MAKLPVLMYHNVTDKLLKIEKLTIDVNYLEQQFSYLKANGYQTYHLKELEGLTTINKKSVVITFDDVTLNQKEFVMPLLKKYNLKATFFIPFAYLGLTDQWNEGVEPIMSIADLKELDDLVEFGHHSYRHRAYDSLSSSEIKDDFDACYSICENNNLNVYGAVAYPYGNFPKREPHKSAFFVEMKKNNMKLGLRIGNKLNSFPFANPYEIMRIDVRGNEKMWKFKLNLKFGKLF
ncbi:MAG: polysaccharide deacetylase family protein [Flavobacteriaceae bacterium]|jgi:peptidoglycan/xylan/chitin deacetylase (PgdA/CDA1 family)|nr:polysaccharide deacetylase family protein [Flavobacteriaceae bacterium]